MKPNIFWLLALLMGTHAVAAQTFTPSLNPVAHVEIEGGTGALVVEQDRPFVWIARRTGGIDTIDLGNIEDPILSTKEIDGLAIDLTTFKVDDRYYLAMAMEEGHIDIIDISQPGEPETVATIDRNGPFTNLFAYKHSNGQRLLLAGGASVAAFDLAEVATGKISSMWGRSDPVSPNGSKTTFLFAGYDPASDQDRLYRAGTGGYFVYDFSDPKNLRTDDQLVAIQSAAVQEGRAIVPFPDGKHALTLAEYRTAPVRFFSLEEERVRTAVGAWMNDWDDEYVSLQIRWPFAFVTGLEAGLLVVNIYDPGAPYTDSFFHPNIDSDDAPLARERRGYIDVDVRNHDGLIVLSDLDSGFWALRLEGFGGWHGHNWGLPNMSSAQDWDNGPNSPRQ